MKKLQASNDKTKFALVDNDVFETIREMGLKFGIDKSGHFRSTTEIKLPGMEKKKQLYLHRFVWLLKTGEKPSLTIDHIDINPANNCFKNLRLATRQEQNQHQNKRKDNTSDYIGVCHKHYKRGNGYYYWYTQIQRPNGKRETKLFPYDDEGKIAAAKWYDAKALEYFGEFCGELNFPDDNK